MSNPSSTSSSELGRLARRAALVAAPFLLALLAELFVLPIDAFTFRVSEALVVHRLRPPLPGPFYPDQEVERGDEQGELAGRTRLAAHRRVRWATDRWGFRRDERSCPGERFDVVLVGDSNIWESVLSQEDLLASRLGGLLGRCVYPYATASASELLADPRLDALRPRTVVYVLSQGTIGVIPAGTGAAAPPSARAAPAFERLLVLADRALKAPLLHYLQAEASRRLERLYRRWVLGYDGARLEPLGFSRVGADGRTLFSAVELARPAPSDDELASAARRLKDLQGAFSARDIRFVFFPVPAKSAVHHRLVPLPEPDATIPRLMPFLRREGVAAADPWSAFIAAAEGGQTLYEPDDNHWNAAGAALAARLLARELGGVSPGRPARAAGAGRSRR